MRRVGNPMELLVALILLGVILQFIGSGPLLVLAWAAVGVYAIVALWPLFSVILRKVLLSASQLGAHTSEAEVPYEVLERDPYWEAYLAASRRDLHAVKRLVQLGRVEPRAMLPDHAKRAADSSSLYEYASSTGFSEALEFFDAWARMRANDTRQSHSGTRSQ